MDITGRSDRKDDMDKYTEKEPVLRSFNEKEVREGIKTGLSLRNQIESIIDRIWEEGFDGIWFIGIGGTYASCMQAEVYMRGRSSLSVFADNAAEFLTTGNKRFSSGSVVILSSVSGTTDEMVRLVRCVKEKGARVFSFIDMPGSLMTQENMYDFLVVSPKNEQLKFYEACNYLMYKNGEFPDYAHYCAMMEEHLADALVTVEKEADAWGKETARSLSEFIQTHPDYPHYFIGSGNLYGAAYSHAMCYWEEQLWIRTKSISCQEFFHGCLEIVVKDTPVTLLVGEDEQRPLALRVAAFLPKVCENYRIIDTKEYALEGIDPEYRGTISHLVVRAVLNRLDAYMEYYLQHPMTIRRYYRQMEY